MPKQICRHRAHPIGVCRDERSAAAQIVHGLVELFIGQRGVKADAYNADILAVAELHAVAFELAQKCGRADGIYGRAGVAAVEIHCRSHAGGENVLCLAREAQLAQTRDIVNAGARGVISEVYIFPAACAYRVNKVNGAVEHLIAEVERAVHVEQKQFRSQKLIHCCSITLQSENIRHII